jgi:hypothetical protein
MGESTGLPCPQRCYMDLIRIASLFEAPPGKKRSPPENWPRGSQIFKFFGRVGPIHHGMTTRLVISLNVGGEICDINPDLRAGLQ